MRKKEEGGYVSTYRVNFNIDGAGNNTIQFSDDSQGLGLSQYQPRDRGYLVCLGLVRLGARAAAVHVPYRAGALTMPLYLALGGSVWGARARGLDPDLSLADTSSTSPSSGHWKCVELNGFYLQYLFRPNANLHR